MQRSSRSSRFFLLVVLLLLTAPTAAAQQGPLHGLDAYIEQGLRDWTVPGLAIAVVKDDSVIFARGYGVRECGEERAAERQREIDASRMRGTRPLLPLERYAGTYTDDLMGEMRLAHEGNRLVLYYAPDYIADLEHWHHDVFRAVWRRPGFGRAFVTFAVDAQGRVATMQVEDFGTFRRSAGRAAATASR